MVDFVVVQEDIEQLHEYCLLCTNATSTKLKELNRELVDYKKGVRVAEDPELGDLTPEVIDGLEQFQIPQWEDTQTFLVTAMCLVLLSALLERGLKMLCEAFAPPGKRARADKKGISKIATYIKFLQNECGLEFSEPDSSVRIRDEFRKVRNDFAHGDWDSVRSIVHEHSLRGAFEACSILFCEIEDAYQKHELDKLS